MDASRSRSVSSPADIDTHLLELPKYVPKLEIVLFNKDKQLSDDLTKRRHYIFDSINEIIEEAVKDSRRYKAIPFGIASMDESRRLMFDVSVWSKWGPQHQWSMYFHQNRMVKVFTYDELKEIMGLLKIPIEKVLQDRIVNSFLQIIL
jgi:hypothetical protein